MSCTRNYNIDVQGHRGARGLAPENTIYGFKKALARDWKNVAQEYLAIYKDALDAKNQFNYQY